HFAQRARPQALAAARSGLPGAARQARNGTPETLTGGGSGPVGRLSLGERRQPGKRYHYPRGRLVVAGAGYNEEGTGRLPAISPTWAAPRPEGKARDGEARHDVPDQPRTPRGRPRRGPPHPPPPLAHPPPPPPHTPRPHLP